MDILITIVTIYIVFGFIRAIYRLATGFLYTPLANNSTDDKKYTPLVTVVIPAWNEAVGITSTVRSVINNGYPKLEIIIVDDGSTDTTATKVKEIIKKSQQLVKLITQVNSGKSGALNAGIARAEGELILTLDADSYLEPGSIAKMVKALADDAYSVAIGEVVVGNTNTWLGRAQHYEYSVGFHIKRAQHVFDSAYIFPGALTMFRTTVLQEVGEFTDYSSTEDLDISMRIKMAGHKIAYVDSAICVTEGASTVRGLLNQRTRWRHGYLECLLHHKDFLLSPKKGWYLTLVDLPLQIFGVIEVLMFPLILGLLCYLLAANINPLALVAAYCLVPFILLMLGDLREKYQQLNLWIFAVPIMLIFIETIEYIALLKSLYRTVYRKRTVWTVWQRTGVDN
ncbi:MAG TPA: glycosyltransferase [Candidatus Saccharimonadales bacterium]|nr:glycosyltransferase [Candidatus Saccharimonadales bacterium]